MIVFFVLRTAGLVRYFEPSIRILAERGHHVHIGFPFRPKGGDQQVDWTERYALPGPGEPMTTDDPESVTTLARLVEETPNISWGFIRQQRDDNWQEALTGLRGCRDYLRYFNAAFRDAKALRERATYSGVPYLFASLANLPLVRSRLGLYLLRRILAACELAVPVSQSAVDEILDIMPDVVLVSRLIDYGSVQVDYVRASQFLGIPAGLPVASWDNLTNKGLMRVLPDFVTVWNEFQKQEAVELHGMPEGRVWVTGAQTFDVWFDRKPSVNRVCFCERFGFDPERRLLVYLGSSRSIAGYEVDIVRRWLSAVRNHDDPLVREANVIIRPHPTHAEQWEGADLSAYGAVTVSPRGGAVPITEEQRNDFFDTLFHAGAIVGLNTSAQIEAAVVGRPVLVFIDPEADTAREGTLETVHFRYLSDPEHGIASVAETLTEHLAQLSAALRQPIAERGRRFVREFVRPHGLELPAAPFLADAIERGATTREYPELGTTPLLLALRGLLFLSRPLLHRLFRHRPRRTPIKERDFLKGPAQKSPNAQA